MVRHYYINMPTTKPIEQLETRFVNEMKMKAREIKERFADILFGSI